MGGWGDRHLTEMSHCIHSLNREGNGCLCSAPFSFVYSPVQDPIPGSDATHSE